MIVCIAVTELLGNDAIGNDVCHQCLALNANHIPAVVFAEKVADNRMSSYVIDKKRLFDIIADRDAILIYHHGGVLACGARNFRKSPMQAVY